jgi:uncharacterized protein YndB with AHSA1/START domain
MGPFSAEVEMDVPRERVFGFLADLANRSAFTDHFLTDFHLARIESAGEGASARFCMQGPGADLWFDTEITEAAFPHRITERGRGGRLNRIPATTVWEVVEGPGALSTVRVTFWTEPSNPLDRVREAFGRSSAARRGFRTALRRLRDLLEEGGTPTGRTGVAGGNRHATGVP